MRMRHLTGLIGCVCLIFFIPGAATSPSPPPAFPFLYSLTSQCPLSFHPKSLLHVNSEFLERTLTSERRNSYAAVLFYTSWCPFSQVAYMTFEAFSSMYPDIEHLAVEQSSAMPSLFSRYGIHSLPAILMANQNSRIRFQGSTDLNSLTEFYKKTTGSEPIQYIALDHSQSLASYQKSIMQSWIGSSIDEIMSREPYLIFSVLFIFLRVLLYVVPRILYHLRPIWASYRPSINLEIFGETNQILNRILHIIDLKRVWSKLRLCKTRNFHQGAARSARVWASSLASVSLGKTSTSRLSS